MLEVAWDRPTEFIMLSEHEKVNSPEHVGCYPYFITPPNRCRLFKKNVEAVICFIDPFDTAGDAVAVGAVIQAAQGDIDDTMSSLLERYPDANLFFILGENGVATHWALGRPNGYITQPRQFAEKKTSVNYAAGGLGNTINLHRSVAEAFDLSIAGAMVWATAISRRSLYAHKFTVDLVNQVVTWVKCELTDEERERTLSVIEEEVNHSWTSSE